MYDVCEMFGAVINMPCTIGKICKIFYKQEVHWFLSATTEENFWSASGEMLEKDTENSIAKT